jgi:hypothetical protein
MFDPNFKFPAVHEWTLNIQPEVPGGLVAQARLLGKRGMRLQRSYDINQIDAAPILPSFLIMKQNVRPSAFPTVRVARPAPPASRCCW